MSSFIWPLLVALLAGASISNNDSVNADQGPETLASRSYFYVGGEYVDVYMSTPPWFVKSSWDY